MKHFLIIVFLSSSVLNGVDGTLDLTFGPSGTGFVATDFGSSTDRAQAVVIDNLDRIVVGGQHFVTHNNFALARYLPNGDLDVSFGSSGIVITDFGTSASDIANSVVIQSDGKIVAFGTCDTTGTAGFGVARYQLSGDLDTTFNPTGGVPGTRCDVVGAGTAIGQAVALQPDGKIVGCALIAGVDIGLIRYNTDGTLDTKFGTGGISITSLGGTDTANAMVLQEDGKILVTGRSDLPLYIARFTTNGQLDPTFGTGGFTTTDIAGVVEEGRAILVQADGKIVVGGYANFPADRNFVLVRYTAKGILDTTFGAAGTGIVTTNLGGTDDDATAILQQPDGKIVLGGKTNAIAANDAALARYSADGIVDTTFGTSGTGFVISSEITGADNRFNALALTSDGKILAVGETDSGATEDFLIVRYTNDSISSTRSPVAKILTGKFRTTSRLKQ